MFIGHYGVGFFAKALRRDIPLWVLFIAVQLIDVFWACFVMLGVERVRIVPGITATNPLDLYYMPYTHSLVGVLGWSAAGFAAYRLFSRSPFASRAALLVALAVLSHWFLDLIVHRPDLPLYDDAAKVGLGLWNLPALSFLLEAALLFGGIYVYARSADPFYARKRTRMLIFGAVMAVGQIGVFFGPPPPSPAALAITGLAIYIVYAAAARWLEGSLPQSRRGETF